MSIIGRIANHIELEKLKTKLIKKLDSLDDELGDLTWFAYQNNVKPKSKKYIKNSIDELNEIYLKSKDIDVIVYWVLRKITSRLISSGAYHSGRGNLGWNGEPLLRINTISLNRSVELGDLSKKDAEIERKKLIKNIDFVG